MALHTTTRRAVLTAAVGLATGAGCLGNVTERSQPTYGRTEARWPMLGRNQHSTNAIDANVSAGPYRTRRLFRATTGDRFGAPICVGETVFVSRVGTENHTGGAYALDVATGEERWYIPDVVDYTTPAVYGETVIFSGNGNTYAVDRATGEIHWRSDVGESGSHKKHLKRDGTIVVGGGRHVFALDASTGEIRWQSRKIGVPGGLSADDERIYVTSGYDGQASLLALDWESGDVLWRGDADEASGYPVVTAGTVLAMDDGVLYALDAQTGSSKWTYETEADGGVPPAVSPDGRRVFVAGANEPRVHAVGLADGRRKWTVEARSDVQPLVTRDSLFLGLFDHVFRVSRSERRVVDSITLPAEITSPLTLGNRGLLFTGRTASETYYNYALVPNANG